jgi:hypothetical protein
MNDDHEDRVHDHQDGRLYDQDFWHSLNQGYAVSGLPPVMPDDWKRTEEMDYAVCLELPYDGDAVARRLAGHMIGAYIKIRDLWANGRCGDSGVPSTTRHVRRPWRTCSC